MIKRRLAVAISGAAVLVLTAGMLMASNMGFRLRLGVKGPGPVSLSGLNFISLPYLPQQDIVNLGNPETAGRMTAGALLAYINEGECVGTPAAAVQKLDRATDTYLSHDGCSGRDFDLEPGEAFFLVMRSDASFVIAGTHDPAHGVLLEAAGAGSQTGQNFFAPPYHSVSATASELFLEIGLAQNLQKFLPVNDTYVLYTFGSPDFSLQPGEGYGVKMQADMIFTPSHY